MSPAENVTARKGAPEEVQIAFLLTRLGARQANAFAELLRPLDLRPKQFAIMNLVALGDGPSQQQIGASMELDPSGLISTIDELEERGWLERRRSSNDRRRHALYRSRAEELTSPLGKRERSTLLGLLGKLA
jgi:hypothetical protein